MQQHVHSLETLLLLALTSHMKRCTQRGRLYVGCRQTTAAVMLGGSSMAGGGGSQQPADLQQYGQGGETQQCTRLHRDAPGPRARRHGFCKGGKNVFA